VIDLERGSHIHLVCLVERRLPNQLRCYCKGVSSLRMGRCCNRFDRWIKRVFAHALKPVLLCVNSLSVVSIYAWFRVFDLARQSNGSGVGAFWAIATAVGVLVCAAVFGVTWRVEWALAKAFAQIQAAKERKAAAREAKDNAAKNAATAERKVAQERKLELLIQRQVVAMLGKSALLAAVFSAHFAVLETLPLGGVDASIAYAGGATALALGVVAAGEFSSKVVHYCFCSCCCMAAHEDPKTFERAKVKTVNFSIGLVGNCAAWLVGMVYNDMFARALAEAEADGRLSTDLVSLSKWLLCFFLCVVCATVLVLKLKITRLLDADGDGDVDVADCLGIDLHAIMARCSRCCDAKAARAAADGEQQQPEFLEEGERPGFTLAELVDRACLYTAMFSLYRAIRYAASPESELRANVGELGAALGQSRGSFLIAAAAVTVFATALSAWLERAASRLDAQATPALVHLYDYVTDFGMQGMAYVVGRLWYSGITAWLDAKGTEHGVDTESILPLSLMAVVSTGTGLLATVIVRKVFKGAVLFQKRDDSGKKKQQESGLATEPPGAVSSKIMV